MTKTEPNKIPEQKLIWTSVLLLVYFLAVLAGFWFHLDHPAYQAITQLLLIPFVLGLGGLFFYHLLGLTLLPITKGKLFYASLVLNLSTVALLGISTLLMN